MRFEQGQGVLDPILEFTDRREVVGVEQILQAAQDDFGLPQIALGERLHGVQIEPVFQKLAALRDPLLHLSMDRRDQKGRNSQTQKRSPRGMMGRFDRGWVLDARHGDDGDDATTWGWCNGDDRVGATRWSAAAGGGQVRTEAFMVAHSSAVLAPRGRMVYCPTAAGTMNVSA